MNFIDYVEIENVKGLDKLVRIQLSNPSVLIGPSNVHKRYVVFKIAATQRGESEEEWL